MQPSLRRINSLPNRSRPRSYTGTSSLASASDASDSETGGPGFAIKVENPAECKASKPSRSPRRSPISEFRKHLSRPLKREATSPVYLDTGNISVPSIPSAARRVAQCVTGRLRATDSDVASLSSQDSPRQSADSPRPSAESTAKDDKKARRVGIHRNKWTKEETDALVNGCNRFGIGQWKAIRDAEPILVKRSPGDLKDRFRTYFPDAYRQHYPNAKTHMSDRQRSKDPITGKDLFTENAARKERKQFSPAEDEALKRGYAKYGTAWSSIARDPILANRKSTDLRDRFRNAFPDLYAAAGYKSRPRKPGNELYSLADSLDLSLYAPNGLQVYPAYSNRAFEQITRSHLPSLDFLKEHGESAFNGFHGQFQSSDSSDLSSTEDYVPPMRGMSVNITPRPNVTPRPNDTTPRPPPPPLAGGVSGAAIISPGVDLNMIPAAELMPPPYRPSLHKAQSSMDLGRFSQLNLGVGLPEGHANVPQESSLSPPAHYADLAASAHLTSPYVKQTLNFSSPELSVSPQEPHYPGSLANAGICSIFNSPDADRTSSNWAPDFDAASRSFPTAFDCQNYEFSSVSGIMNMRDAQSSVSSFQSSTSSNHSYPSSSSQSDHDQVLYAVEQPFVISGGMAGMRSTSSFGSGANETLFPAPGTSTETNIFTATTYDEPE